MLWVIQRNLYSEDGYQCFVGALERLGLPYQVVKPVPFFNKIVDPDFDSFAMDISQAPEVEVDAKQGVIVMGANTLAKVAMQRGWCPGAFMNENFSYEKWRDGFGSENMLNADVQIVRPRSFLQERPWLPDRLFARPVEDNKAFAGAVMSRADFEELMKSACQLDGSGLGALHEATEILVAPVRHINAEYRLFVVGGRVVTGSLYKQGVRVAHSPLLPDEVVAFGEQMIARWTPHDAFVLDVAETDEGCKVVEVNGINSAGFYESDVYKIILALEDLCA